MILRCDSGDCACSVRARPERQAAAQDNTMGGAILGGAAGAIIGGAATRQGRGRRCRRDHWRRSRRDDRLAARAPAPEWRYYWWYDDRCWVRYRGWQLSQRVAPLLLR